MVSERSSFIFFPTIGAFLGLVVFGAGCRDNPSKSTEPIVDTTAEHLEAAQCAYFDVNGKDQICHYTGSARNPYVILKTSEQACINGHAGHAQDYITTADPTSPAYDPTCSGAGCLPEGAPCDATLGCCGNSTCTSAGVCACDAGWMGVTCDVPTSGEPNSFPVNLPVAHDQHLTAPGIDVVVPANVAVTVNGTPAAGSITVTAQLDGDTTQIFDLPASEEEEDATGMVEAGGQFPIFPTYRFGPAGATFDPPLQATLVVPKDMTEPVAWLCDDDGSNCEKHAGLFFDDTSVTPAQTKLFIEIDHFSAVVITNRNPIGIRYTTGPVMQGTPKIYYIWYGGSGGAGWPDSSTSAILTNLASTMSGTPYMAINTGYSDTTGNVSGNLSFGGSFTYTGPLTATTLSQPQIQTIVQQSIGPGRLPSDTNGIYFVLTGPNVRQNFGSDSFCTRFCGWHYMYPVAGGTIKYSFVGDAATLCPSACMVQRAASPNGNPGADGMASVIAHELVETLSDPELMAWRDSAGNENGDKCAWNFGTTPVLPSGAKYNVTFGSRKYLIQQNWDPVKGVCAMFAPVFTGSGIADGTPCNDNNACTRTDQYRGGVCVGYNPVSCTASDQCHLAGACNASTGVCTNPTKSNGATCDDMNPCTVADSCQSGGCVSGTPTSVGIQFETRPHFAGPPGSTAAAISTWNSLAAGASGYCTLRQLSTMSGYSNQTTCSGTNSNIAYHIKLGVGVTAAQAGAWDFRAGGDYGKGGTMLVDGVELSARWTDMWWNGGFTDPNQYLAGTITLSAGLHTVEVYGFESAADGPGTFEFRAPGGAFTTFATSGLNTCVPPPADGSSSSNASSSCATIHATYPTRATGTYWLDPDGAGGNAPFQAYCDMTLSGGGWTLIQSHVLNTATNSTAGAVSPGSGTYLASALVQSLANVSMNVRIDESSPESLYVESTDGFPITRLRALLPLNDDNLPDGSHWTGSGQDRVSYFCLLRDHPGSAAAVYPTVYWAQCHGGALHVLPRDSENASSQPSWFTHGFGNDSASLNVWVR